MYTYVPPFFGMGETFRNSNIFQKKRSVYIRANMFHLKLQHFALYQSWSSYKGRKTMKNWPVRKVFKSFRKVHLVDKYGKVWFTSMKKCLLFCSIFFFRKLFCFVYFPWSYQCLLHGKKWWKNFFAYEIKSTIIVKHEIKILKKIYSKSER